MKPDDVPVGLLFFFEHVTRENTGVFDENDNHTFEEEEFVEMLLAMYRGMAAMFFGRSWWSDTGRWLLDKPITD